MNCAVANFFSILFPLQNKAAGVSHEQQSSTLDARPHQLKIFYGTQTGTAKLLAEQLMGEAEMRGQITVNLTDLKDCDPKECLTQQVSVMIITRSCLETLYHIR